MKRDIAGEVRRIIHKQLDIDEPFILRAASFVDDLGADSVQMVQLSIALEERFDIELEDKDVLGMRTVGDAIAVVERRLREARPQNDLPASL